MAASPDHCYRHPREETRIRCSRCDRPICPECMNPAPVGHHCPTCVGEARRSVRRPLAPIRRLRRLSLTTILLAVILAVFVVEIARGGLRDLGVLVDMGAMVPALVEDGQYWRLVTAIFLHAGPLHLLFNVYALVIFGNLVEEAFGTVRFAAVYFVTGFAASAASFAFGSEGRVAVGASGAIFGLLGAWLTYNWRRRELSMAQANVRMALLLIGINLVFGLSVRGIDNTAHVGGLIAGVLAGLAAEGFGGRAMRTASRVGGLALILGGALALVLWRIG
ncbi:MAG TPA: rhomboid family intramembrane serine protease [Actinomycetota bacterium]